MAITGITSSTTPQPNAIQASWKQRKEAFDQIGQALQSGDLDAAKQAFAALTQSASGAPQTGVTGQPSQTGVSQALQALGDALQSGDIDKAKQAYAAFTQALKKAGAKHHHHHRRADSTSGDSAAATATPILASDTVGTNLSVTA